MVEFKDLNIVAAEPEVATLEINGQTITCKKHLPIADKQALVLAVLNSAFDGEIFNTVKADYHFDIQKVIYYTDLHFEQEELDNAPQLHEKLLQSGIIDFVNKTIGGEDSCEEFQLSEWIDILGHDAMDYNLSAYNTADVFSRVLKETLADLPEQFSKINDMLKDFDAEKFKQVFAMANAAGFQG